MTAWRWWRSGKLPVPAYQTPSGSVMVSVPEDREGVTAVYARVSAHDQTKDLDRQVARVTAWATVQGHRVDRAVTEVGSGRTSRRRKLLRVLANPDMATIIVEPRDRLARRGRGAVKAALQGGRRGLLAAGRAGARRRCRGALYAVGAAAGVEPGQGDGCAVVAGALQRSVLLRIGRSRPRAARLL